MRSGLRWQLGGIVFIVLLCVVYLLPSFISMEKMKPVWLRDFLPSKKLNLGLDLAGGVHIVMGLRRDETLVAAAAREVDFLKSILENSVSEVSHIPGTTKLKVVAASEDKLGDIRDKVHSRWQGGLATDSAQGLEIIFTYKKDYEAQLLRQSLDQTLERIRNRIDEFGVAEPSIQTQGNDRIIVQIPGYKNPKEAKDIVGRTAQLEFRLAYGIEEGQGQDGTPQYDPSRFKDPVTNEIRVLAQVVDQVQKEKNISFKEGDEKTGEKFSDFVQKLNIEMSNKIPNGYVVRFERREDPQTGTIERVPYLVTNTVAVSGEYLKDAYPSRDGNTNQPIVAFEFSAKGAKALGDVTKPENKGMRMAIMLDGMVMSAPAIQAHLTDGKGTITLGAGTVEEKQKEAQQLSIVLRAGALPAPLDFLFERTIGPSLGEDSIKQGQKATIIGILAVFIFMLFYYKLSGAVADVALFLNLILILAVLAMFQATLTLPGIAGIALTIGMAVDSNVIVYERIREELDLGKMPNAAVEAGFSRAWWTVLDSNVTTLIAAFVLLKYGTGSIKGFAVTLIIGLISSMFTAFYISKFIFSFFMKRRMVQNLSI
ncbi:MAG: protein translocase subunit SecD [Deltaproteobacteria bacterium]|nr:protein translocase subunit SecD [Deltaproteobacteria bacterium]